MVLALSLVLSQVLYGVHIESHVSQTKTYCMSVRTSFFRPGLDMCVYKQYQRNGDCT
jgi:hypothetical protein